MKLEVYKYGTNQIMGIFLNVGNTPLHEVVVWYLNNDGIIKGAYFEDIELKEVEDFGMC